MKAPFWRLLMAAMPVSLLAAASGQAVRYPVVDEGPLGAAVVALLCGEVREAVNRGQLDREGQRWLLANGHRCRDDRLLFDALGF
jgi:hypothetical protein